MPVGDVQENGGGPVTGNVRIELERALAVADRANNASMREQDGRWIVIGDPTEGALLVAARKAGLRADDLNRRFARVGEVPFSAERKLMSTVHTDADTGGRVLLFTKGAPDVLLTAAHTSSWVGKGVSCPKRGHARFSTRMMRSRDAASAPWVSRSGLRSIRRSRPTGSAKRSSVIWCSQASSA